jgi:DNA-binding transcriptional LysR family regulator
LNIDDLRYARAAARHGSFSAAARACLVSQPALSKSIAQLEGGLGGKLFDRSTRGASLTPLGTQVLPLIGAAVNAVDGLIAAAQAATTDARQTIRLGVSPLIDSGLVAHAFAACRDLLADRTLLLREANMTPLRNALLNGDLDLVLIPAVTTLPGCEQRTVYQEPIAVLQPPRATAANGTGPVTLDALSSDPLILVPDQCGLTAFTTNLFADHDIPMRRYPGEAASYQVLEEWTALGLGSALLPRSKLTDPHGARELRHHDQPILISYQAAWQTNSRASTQIATLVDTIATGSDTTS